MSSSSSTIFTSLLLLGLVGVLLAASITKREEPLGVQCHSNKECQNDHCCALGPSRYSLPQCIPRRDKGEACRPNDQKINTTLYYPNDNQVTVAEVSYIICPCKDGLTCDRKEGVCA